MKTDLQACPGDSLSAFLKHIAYDLKLRRVEYLIIAYFNLDRVPIAMRQISGRSSWVGYSLDEISQEAETLQASGVALVHNHPVASNEPPTLQPSTADVRSLIEFLRMCNEKKLAYHGSWIVSKGHVNEILYHTVQASKKATELNQGQNFADLALNLSPHLAQTVAELTKPLVLAFDHHKIGEVLCENNMTLKIQARVVSDVASTKEKILQVLITIGEYDRFGNAQNVANETTEILTLEETSRGCHGLLELKHEVDRHVKIKTSKEYLEVNLYIAPDRVKGGFFIKNDEITAFISVRNVFVFMAINHFEKLHKLFSLALDELESLAAQAND